MMHLNLAEGRKVGVWSRLYFNAQDNAELHAAVDAMWAEAGYGSCDVCDRRAAFVWERTAAQRKKMQGRKVRGARAEVLPVSWRCTVHVPHAFPELGENYRDARVLTGAARLVA